MNVMKNKCNEEIYEKIDNHTDGLSLKFTVCHGAKILLGELDEKGYKVSLAYLDSQDIVFRLDDRLIEVVEKCNPTCRAIETVFRIDPDWDWNEIKRQAKEFVYFLDRYKL